MGFVGLLERLAPTNVNGDDPRALSLGRDQVRRGGRLAGEVCAPENDEVRVRRHVLFGVDLHRSGEREAETAQASTYDGGFLPLKAAQIREAEDQPATNRV